MTRMRLCVLAAALALWPTAAHAQDGGFWDFLEGFSGPGPFNYGVIGELRVACRVETGKDKDGNDVYRWLGAFESEGNTRPCVTKPRTVHSFITLRAGRATTDFKALFNDRENELKGTVAVNAVQGLAMRQLDPAISVGAGMGVLWFSGATISSNPTRPFITPISVAITPLRLLGSKSRLARFVVFNFEENVVFKTLDKDSFNSASTSQFIAHTDMVRSFSIVLDIPALFVK